MKILTCIKQSNDSSDISRFDAHALEEAISIKQELENQKIDLVDLDVVTIGTSESSQILKRAFGMGADNGYHIVCKKKYASSYETASRLAVIAQKASYDLILTGIMSQDMMAGETGPMLAEIMGLPCVTGAVRTNLTLSSYSIEVEQEMENGFRNCLDITLPAVLTIQAGINTPGYPTLSRMLAAGKKKIHTIRESDLSCKNSDPVQIRQTYVSLENPQKTRNSQVLQGTITDKARHLLTVLQEKALI
jgi:electron transfer flavoprotein beta subunit